MFKFLRKYNTIILVLGGAFLMVAFLLPQAIQQFSPGMGARPVFKAAGVTYDTLDLNEARREMQAIGAALNPAARMGGGFTTVQRDWTSRLGIESVEHYIMLAALAEDLDLMNHGAVPQEVMIGIGSSFVGASGLSEFVLDAMQQGFDDGRASIRDDELIARAFQRADAIVRLRNLHFSAATLSRPETQAIGTMLLDSVEANVAALSGLELGRTLGDPTEERLQELYELYRESEFGDNEYGFSYLLDNAVRFETMLIDRTTVRNAIELDAVEVRKYYTQNRDRFAGDFLVERTRVEESLRDLRATEIIDEAKDAVNVILVRALSRIPQDGTGLRILPDDWAQVRPSFQSLADAANQSIASRVTTTSPAATVATYNDQWYTLSDISGNADLRNLRLPFTGRGASLAGAAFTLPEFSPVIGYPEGQVGLTLPGLTNGFGANPRAEGYIRFLDTRLAGPPASIEDVRDRVTEDALALAGYEELAAQLDDLASLVIEDSELGVSALFDATDIDPLIANSATVQIFDPLAPIGMATPFVKSDANREAAELLSTEVFAKAVIDRVMQWDPTEDVSALPAADRVVALMIPETQSFGIALISTRFPTSAERLRRYNSVPQLFVNEEAADGDPLKSFGSGLRFEVLAERMNFVDLDPEATAAAQEEPAPDADSATAG